MKNLKFGGVTVNDVNFNGTPVNIINFNGVKVWEREAATNALCFTAVQANSTIYIVKTGESILGSMSFSLEYSTDGTNWQAYTFPSGRNKTGPTITLANIGSKVYFRSTSDTVKRFSGTSANVNAYAHFSGSGAVDVSGEITTLIKQSGGNVSIGYAYDFNCLFEGMTSLRHAADLQLPSTSLNNYCYYRMFSGCTNLLNSPELPATSSAQYCYSEMFYGCTSLIYAPTALPFNSQDEGSCEGMFQDCVNLITAPELPATTLALYCYNRMFQGCSKLSSAPELPAEELDEGCYRHMFEGTAITSMPSLPAKTLTSECYASMFQDCKNLISAEIDATSLSTDSLKQMFYGCSKLNHIKVHFTSWGTEGGTDYTLDWVSGVANNGTFECPFGLATERGTSRIPTNWTIQRYTDYHPTDWITPMYLAHITSNSTKQGQGYILYENKPSTAANQRTHGIITNADMALLNAPTTPWGAEGTTGWEGQTHATTYEAMGGLIPIPYGAKSVSYTKNSAPTIEIYIKDGYSGLNQAELDSGWITSTSGTISLPSKFTDGTKQWYLFLNSKPTSGTEYNSYSIGQDISDYLGVKIKFNY